MMPREDAVRKATACLRLAERATTPGEQAAAAAAAQRIMDEHNLQVEMLRIDGAETEPEEDVADFGRRPGGALDEQKKGEPWRWYLAHYIAKANGCFIYRTTGYGSSRIDIVGRPGDVETVRYLYGWLSKEVWRLSQEQGKGMGSPWRREFRLGAVDMLGARLRSERARTVADMKAAAGTALVKVNQALARLDGRYSEAEAFAKAQYKFRNGRSGGAGQFDHGARAAGAQAAKNIDLGGGRSRIGGRHKEIGGGK